MVGGGNPGDAGADDGEIEILHGGSHCKVVTSPAIVGRLRHEHRPSAAGRVPASSATCPRWRAATAAHLSYRDLWRKVSVMSMHLSGRFGLQRGDRVAFAMTNCVESIEVMYAIWHAGLCAVPMNAKLHAKEFAFILENSGAKLCFVTPDLADDHRRGGQGGARAQGDRRRHDALLRLHGGRRSHRHGRGRGRPIRRGCSTPRARPAGPRARRSPIAICWR